MNKSQYGSDDLDPKADNTRLESVAREESIEDIRRAVDDEKPELAPSEDEPRISMEYIMDSIRQMATGEHPALQKATQDTAEEERNWTEWTILQDILHRSRQYLDDRNFHALWCIGLAIPSLQEHRAKGGFDHDQRLDGKRVSRNIKEFKRETLTDLLRTVAYQTRLIEQSGVLSRFKSIDGLQAAVDAYDAAARKLEAGKRDVSVSDDTSTTDGIEAPFSPKM